MEIIQDQAAEPKRHSARTASASLIALSVAAGATGAFTVASATAAGASKSSCPSERVCIWKDDNYSGDGFAIDPGSLPREPNWSAVGGIPASFEDTVSSYYNNTSKHFGTFFEHDNYGGNEFCSDPQASSGNLSNHGGVGYPHPEDRWSSHIVSTTPGENLAEVELYCTFIDRD